MSLSIGVPSIFLFDAYTPLMEVSKLFILAKALLDVDNITGPLLFLKIEGDKHFFPPSNSLISKSFYLFLFSFSVGSPRLL
jgi:hypothetical protein